MPSLVILGAGGFLGSTLVNDGGFPMSVRAVARRAPAATATHAGVSWIAADLSDAASLDGLLSAGDVVINLAYIPNAAESDNVRLVDNILEACVRARVARLVHCSTAIVVGASRAAHIVESTACAPSTPYEKTKLLLEQRVLGVLPRGVDVSILRPTAIVGPGGQNLVKLAGALRRDSGIANYLRACLFGKRRMHLVSARNVAAALIHLAQLPGQLGGNVYNVASDEDPDNNFERVEQILLRSLGLKPRRVPLLPIPAQVLSLLLKLLGRSETNLGRSYDSAKLLGSGFRPVQSVADAVHEFAQHLDRSTGIAPADDKRK